MNNFIRLTEMYANGQSIPIILNCANISSIKKSDRTDDTHIQMRDGKYFFIKEKPDAIWQMITAKANS